MRISTRAEYGIRALIDLAMFGHRGPVQTRDIGRRQGLPEPYLNQLLGTLRRAGFVVSKRGPHGGHLLARPAEAIRLDEVFLVLEGTTSPWECVDTDDPNCIYAPGCGLRPLWLRIKEATDQVLRSTTLADLLPEHPLSMPRTPDRTVAPRA
ncbi:MAG: Rrf2 family transcriptional regulator [Armatimonadota bacterium]|nr:Rrf2 family transcriptional regulator [Armatimonadota bacterium]